MTSTWTPWRRVQAQARKEAIWADYRARLPGFLDTARGGIPADAEGWVRTKLERQAQRMARRWAVRAVAKAWGLTPERIKQIVGRAS